VWRYAGWVGTEVVVDTYLEGRRAGIEVVEGVVDGIVVP
jgi:hypothetical protein